MNKQAKIPIQLRWSDIDANFHLRHSAYYDFGAMSRIAEMEKVGLDEAFFRSQQFGPILFKEACTFRREIILTDEIFITFQLMHCKPNGSRFTIMHEILKADDTLAAKIIISGDWLDYKTRKLLQPPAILGEYVNMLPKHAQFSFL